MRTVLYLVGLAAVCAFLVAAMMMTAPTRAHASDWNRDEFVWDINRVRVTRHHHRPVRYYRAPEYPEDIARRYEIEAHHNERKCLDHFEDAVSTEHTGPEEAMISATKLWAARVSFLWGGRFMNWDNAEDKRVLCDQSNAMDTITGRIIDNVQKLAGNEGKNQRCFIRAIPCSAPLERAEEHGK